MRRLVFLLLLLFVVAGIGVFAGWRFLLWKFEQPGPLSVETVVLIEKGKISESIGKKVFEQMLATGKSAQDLVAEQGLEQVSDTSAIERIIAEVAAAHPQEFERLRGGESKLLGFFVGQIMRATKGKANPKIVNELLRREMG